MTKDEILRIGFFGNLRPLSNFHLKPVELIIDLTLYTFGSNEAGFQASKDPSKAHLFVDLGPREARTLGTTRSIIHPQPNWAVERVNVMRTLTEQKYLDGPERQLLLSTDDKPLVEYNWWHDNFWGDCRCDRCESLFGVNMLGKLLTAHRSKINSLGAYL